MPDRTKLEWLKHEKAVDELRQRQAQGETDLLIHNGVVIRDNLAQLFLPVIALISPPDNNIDNISVAV